MVNQDDGPCMKNIWNLHGLFCVAMFRRLHQDSFRNGPNLKWEKVQGGFKITPPLGHVFFQDPSSEGTQELVCPAEEEGSLDKCDFKEDWVSD